MIPFSSNVASRNLLTRDMRLIVNSHSQILHHQRDLELQLFKKILTCQRSSGAFYIPAASAAD